MDSAKAMLRRSGVESIEAMEPNERYWVSIESDDDLVFEKVGPASLSISHRSVRDGEEILETEIVFRIEGDTWIPIKYVRAPAVHRYDATGLDVRAHLRRWRGRLTESRSTFNCGRS